MGFFLLFISSGVFLGAQITYYFIQQMGPTNIYLFNFFGVKWVLLSFVSLLIFPSLLFLKTSYLNFKKVFYQCSSEIFIIRCFGVITSLFIAPLFFSPIDFIFSSQNFFINQQFGASFINFLVTFLGVMIFDIHHRFFLTLFTPNFFKNLLVYKNLFRSTRLRILDKSIVTNYPLYNLIQSHFLEGIVVISTRTINHLLESASVISVQKRQQVIRNLLVLNKLKKLYPNQIFIKNIDFNQKVLLENYESYLIGKKEFEKEKYSNHTKKNHKIILSDLARSAQKPYLYGECFSLKILKKGNKIGQGIGYLEDGTMVIVEQGSDYIGKFVTVNIRKIWQRSTGTILFASLQTIIRKTRVRKRKKIL